jgi:DNA-binding beta-propeller fold protein YncE
MAAETDTETAPSASSADSNSAVNGPSATNSPAGAKTDNSADAGPSTAVTDHVSPATTVSSSGGNLSALTTVTSGNASTTSRTSGTATQASAGNDTKNESPQTKHHRTGTPTDSEARDSPSPARSAAPTDEKTGECAAPLETDATFDSPADTQMQQAQAEPSTPAAVSPAAGQQMTSETVSAATTSNAAVSQFAAPATAATPNPAVVTTFPVGDDPRNVLLSPDGMRLYVLNGSLGTPAHPGVPAALTVIDTATGNVVGQPIQLGDVNPYQSTASADGKHIYIAATVQDYGFHLLDFDTTTNTITGAYVIGATVRPAEIRADGTPVYVTNDSFPVQSIAVSPNGERLYVVRRLEGIYTNGDPSSQIIVIDTATNATVGQPLKIGRDIHGLLISPDGTHLYATTQLGPDGIDSIVAIDTATGTIADLATGGQLEAISADGQHLYATVFNSTTGYLGVQVIDAATMSPSESPIWVAQTGYSRVDTIVVSADGRRLYIDGVDENLYVADLSTNKVVGMMHVDYGARGLALSPDGIVLYTGVTENIERGASVWAIDTANSLDRKPRRRRNKPR